MEHSEQLNELASALAKAQGEIDGAARDATNPHFRSKFASLASVREAFRDALAKHGLSVVQMPERTADEVAVVTQLLHSSGQWIRCRTSAIPIKHDPQGVGSAISYLRRYSLMAVIGIAPDDDDDGEAAVGRGPQTAPKRHEPKGESKKNEPKSSGASIETWKVTIDACSTIPDLKKYIEPIKQLPEPLLSQARAHWEQRRDAIKNKVTNDLMNDGGEREAGEEG